MRLLRILTPEDLSTERLLELMSLALLMRVVVLLIAVLLIVELIRLLLRLMLGMFLLLVVDEVFTLSLGETINTGTCETGEKLLGEAMVDFLALLTLVLLELVHGVEAGAAGEELMAELGFVVGLLDFVVVLLGVV